MYTWGKGEGYRLGHGNTECVKAPKLLEALQGKDGRIQFIHITFIIIQILLTYFVRFVYCPISYFYPQVSEW